MSPADRASVTHTTASGLLAGFIASPRRSLKQTAGAEPPHWLTRLPVAYWMTSIPECEWVILIRWKQTSKGREITLQSSGKLEYCIIIVLQCHHQW